MEGLEVKPCFVGIDVSRDKLDICVLPNKEHFQVENKCFDALCERLKKLSPTLIVMEESGRYEDAVFRALYAAGLPVCREPSLGLYHYRRSGRERAKSDPIDAEAIAHYGQSYHDRIQLKAPSSDSQERLRQLVNRRDELVKMQSSEKNRLKAPAILEEIKKDCEWLIEMLSSSIQRIDWAIQEEIDSQETLKAKRERLKTAAGVGELTAGALLAWLPELGEISHGQISALVGVAPYHRESGQWKGKRQISGGRTPLRCLLYMSTLSAIRHNEKIKAFYKHLLEKGKPKKVAIVACMRKLLRILNAMLRKQENFQTT